MNMKIERLLGLVIYLLNRDIVNANTLAEKFDVSTRTIQRDIDTLNLVGIPIISIQGINGGYSIIDSFRLEKQITNSEDYQFIISVLKCMTSAYNNKKNDTTLEKLLSVSKQGKSIIPKLKLDFSVSREGSNIDEYLKIIESAMYKEQVIEFEYTSSHGDKTLLSVEPIAVIYKWHAWYMLGYCCTKKDYRLYKVIRIGRLKKTGKAFSIKHENIDGLIASQEKQDNRKYMNVKILCKEEIRISIEEYFPNASITTKEDGEFILQFPALDNESAWKGMLFTYGDKIKIIEPEELKTELMSKAKEIIGVYK
jgi:predicted DNA-binding transcriptional regulator YafY